VSRFICRWTHGNEISVERAAGDSLRITTRPQLISRRGGAEIRRAAGARRIHDRRSIDIGSDVGGAQANAKPLWITSSDCQFPSTDRQFPRCVPLPMRRCVPDSSHGETPSDFARKVFPGRLGAPLVEGRSKVVVLEATPASPVSDARWQPVLEIDPATRWWEPAGLDADSPHPRHLASAAGSHATVTIKHPLGNFVELPKTPENSEPHWQAYPLPLESSVCRTCWKSSIRTTESTLRHQHCGAERGRQGGVDRTRFGRVRRRFGAPERGEKHVHA
jgi:hypothetical protein